MRRRATGEALLNGSLLSGAQHRGLTGRRGPAQMVQATMVTSFALALDEAFDVRCNFVLCAAIVTTLMGGEQIGAVENADLLCIGPYRERAAHVRMRDRVIVQVEANIRRLVNLHSQLQFARVRILRQGQ